MATQTHQSEAARLEDTRMTLGEHLEELRGRLIRSAVAFVLALVVAWGFHETLSDVVQEPLRRAVAWLNADLVEIHQAEILEQGLSPTDFFNTGIPEDASPSQRLLKPIPSDLRGDGAGSGFFFYLRVSLYFAFLGAAPVILWQLWQFIAAGLYRKEKRVVHLYFPASLLLFAAGIVFGFYVMVPYGQYFLARFSLEQFRYDPKVDEYFQFIKSLCLALGLVFQLPILMMGLARLGIVEPTFFARYRGHFLLVALLFAALMTPPDPITQMMMAVPMVLLYEVGYRLSRLGRSSSAAQASSTSA